eukprot:5029020-Pyramimonas_sp.AAC.1
MQRLNSFSESNAEPWTGIQAVDILFSNIREPHRTPVDSVQEGSDPPYNKCDTVTGPSPDL